MTSRTGAQNGSLSSDAKALDGVRGSGVNGTEMSTLGSLSDKGAVRLSDHGDDWVGHCGGGWIVDDFFHRSADGKEFTSVRMDRDPLAAVLLGQGYEIYLNFVQRRHLVTGCEILLSEDAPGKAFVTDPLPCGVRELFCARLGLFDQEFTCHCP